MGQAVKIRARAAGELVSSVFYPSKSVGFRSAWPTKKDRTRMTHDPPCGGCTDFHRFSCSWGNPKIRDDSCFFEGQSLQKFLKANPPIRFPLSIISISNIPVSQYPISQYPTISQANKTNLFHGSFRLKDQKN